MILAIETSCDETGIAILSHPDAGALRLEADLISSQAELHLPYGGVVPELASREHLKNLPVLFNEALQTAGATASQLRAIAVTQGPGLNGCLVTGISFAKGLATARKIPLIPVNHLEGHLLSTHLVGEMPLPMLILLVSGGHTELVLRTGDREYRRIARTRDDAAGEAFDKCATLLGLPYPGGPQLSALAEGGDADRFPLPIGMPLIDTEFSFSGLKTAVRRLVDEAKTSHAGTRVDIAASVQRAIVEALVMKTLRAVNEYKPQSLFLTGGVAANHLLRARLGLVAHEAKIPYQYPPNKWCTDNAAMIGVVAHRALSAGSVPAFSREMLIFEAKPRFPIDEIRNG